jgi:hypothetical protein
MRQNRRPGDLCVPPSASLRGERGSFERQLSSELLIHPYATLRGEPGVRDRYPSGTAQLPRYAHLQSIIFDS